MSRRLVFVVDRVQHECVTALLTTGEAARLLGVSRQHVVDLCDEGVLPCIRVGTHRRVSADAVHELAQPPLTREQEKSLWLHRALLAPLLSDPDTVLAAARDNVLRWKPQQREGGVAEQHLTHWQEILDRGVDTVVAVLTSSSATAHELRQNSPFAGVLAEDTRRQVLQAFVAHWSREHQAAA